MRAINKNFEQFSKKFLFGSAYPLTPIKPFVENFLKLDWEEKFLPSLLYKNAIEALNIGHKEPFSTLLKNA
jgi:hypothetical protein